MKNRKPESLSLTPLLVTHWHPARRRTEVPAAVTPAVPARAPGRPVPTRRLRPVTGPRVPGPAATQRPLPRRENTRTIASPKAVHPDHCLLRRRRLRALRMHVCSPRSGRDCPFST